MKRCVLCQVELVGDMRELELSMRIRTSAGRLELEVALCFNCSHTKTLTPAQLLEEARRRTGMD